jgi:ATP-dependent phosphoenolpyruvate carboxykinase
LKYTRAILDAIHSGELAKVEYETYDVFNLSVPKTCTGVPDELLNPKKSWTGTADFKDEVTKLGELFNEVRISSLRLKSATLTGYTELQKVRGRGDEGGDRSWSEDVVA